MGGFRASLFLCRFFKDKLYPVFERMNIGVGELIHSLQGEDNEKILFGACCHCSFVLMLGGIIYSRRFGNGLLTDASGIFLDGDFQRNKYGEKNTSF